MWLIQNTKAIPSIGISFDHLSFRWKVPLLRIEWKLIIYDKTIDNKILSWYMMDYLNTSLRPVCKIEICGHLPTSLLTV
jgi:hypothetical protein